jgi:hypothetical protein
VFCWIFTLGQEISSFSKDFALAPRLADFGTILKAEQLFTAVQ